MEMKLKSIVMLSAIVTTALSAGLFYAWSVSVIPGTKIISDRGYLETMQSINREVLNPWFFVIFFGPVVLTTWSCYLQFQTGTTWAFWLTLGSTIFYIIGTFGVTAAGNVPLNDVLDKINLVELDDAEHELVRAGYEGRWNQFQYIRTVFSVLSFVLLLIADRISTISNT